MTITNNARLPRTSTPCSRAGQCGRGFLQRGACSHAPWQEDKIIRLWEAANRATSNRRPASMRQSAGVRTLCPPQDGHFLFWGSSGLQQRWLGDESREGHRKTGWANGISCAYKEENGHHFCKGQTLSFIHCCRFNHSMFLSHLHVIVCVLVYAVSWILYIA